MSSESIKIIRKILLSLDFVKNILNYITNLFINVHFILFKGLCQSKIKIKKSLFVLLKYT